MSPVSAAAAGTGMRHGLFDRGMKIKTIDPARLALILVFVGTLLSLFWMLHERASTPGG